ncbi:hypothetical protein NBRC110019_21090 [Neptunitalea chrysea]|uniref:Secretion system C-terminal sorting domain-containing protein n=1 Tax=Neptunitalea chrysea TaxID=1647581 RepID=A0A9W6B841_9FLAO|nr:T9SS type A sorting domain-containing protein [Neptunitalea chrysea]GLB53069.1 hypothetical protein NBRC110019_21090 [Neptunitalea chrysea]
MKNILLLSILCFIGTYTGYSQCTVDPYISTNYINDAKILALREILSNTNDVDYTNPIIPQARYQPYLEGLSVIYTNTANNQVTDSMFNEFAIHIHPVSLQTATPHTINLKVPATTSWLNDFKNTGISGDTTLDNLMSTYNFGVESYTDLSGCNCTWFHIESTEIINVNALVDDFASVTDITYVDTSSDSALSYNYTGINYTISSIWGETSEVQITDITVENGIYTFWLYGGDCLSGCIISKAYEFQLNSDCTYTPMKTEDYELSSLEIYPNPTTDYLSIKVANSDSVENVAIYTANGTLITSKNSTTFLDVSAYASGVYFVKITAPSGASSTKKFIKL